MANTTFSGPVISDNGFVTTSSITAASAVIGGNTISGTELAFIDGVTAGTAAANKAVVLNGSKGITTITSATITTLTSPTVRSATIQASDGTGAATIANSTGIITVAAGLAVTDAANLSFGTGTGTQIGTAVGQKIGFFAAAPVVQQATEGTTTGFTAGSGSAVLADSTFTGGSGTKAYTVGDIVLALKNLGLLAAS